MITFIKSLIMVTLVVLFCAVAGDTNEKAVKDFSFAAFIVCTTLVVCWGKKTNSEHQQSKALKAQRSKTFR